MAGGLYNINFLQMLSPFSKSNTEPVLTEPEKTQETVEPPAARTLRPRTNVQVASVQVKDASENETEEDVEEVEELDKTFKDQDGNPLKFWLAMNVDKKIITEAIEVG
jgi:hypothetical protein